MLTQFVLRVPQRHVLVFYGSVRGRETQGTDNTPATITKWNLKTSVLRFLLLAGLALYLQTPPCLYVFSVLQRLGLFHSSFCFLISLPLVLTSFMILGLLTQLSVQTPILLACPSPALTPSTSAPTHSLTPWVAFFLFVFPFKYLDRSHCGFFPLYIQELFLCHFCFPFFSWNH